MRRRHDTEKLAVLRELAVFAGCSEQELEAASRHVDRAAVGAGTVLTFEGSAGRQAFVIVDGHAEVRVGDEPITTLGPGQFVGEMSMIDHGPRSATVHATTPLDLLVIGPGAFDELVATPAIGRGLSRQLVARMREADASIAPNTSALPERAG